MRALSMSIRKTSVAMCSRDLLRMEPAIIVGFLPLFLANFTSQGAFRQSLIISSATSLASVSFQLPERSTWVEGSIRLMVFEEHPMERGSNSAEKSRRDRVVIG
jgi:hypothetical protein